MSIELKYAKYAYNNEVKYYEGNNQRHRQLKFISCRNEVEDAK